MKQLNLENCAKLSRGEVSCKYDGENIGDLEVVLRYCFPKDQSKVHGEYDYYHARTSEFWIWSSKTTRPTIPLSDFFIEENTIYNTDSTLERVPKQEIPYGVVGVFLSHPDYTRLLEIEKHYNEILNVTNRK